MASKKNTNSNNKQKDKLIEDFDLELDHLNQSLGLLQKSINGIQTGDGENPYWNGENACVMVKNALSQLYSDYDLLNHLCKCRESIKK